jgi:hypothetical protein
MRNGGRSLVAGHQFNTNAVDLREALRRFNHFEERFSVITYDALVVAYLSA